MRVLVVGPGYVGGAVLKRLASAGHDVRALRRSSGPLPGDPEPMVADVTQPLTLTAPPHPFDAVVYAVAPAGRSAEAYRAAYIDGPTNVRAWLGDFTGRFLLVSSTGVYGEAEGGWVNEETPPAPVTPTGEVLLEAEQHLLAHHANTVVLRLGGIYGPGRTRTIERVRSGDMPCPPPRTWGNRIHRDDAAGASIHLLKLANPPSIFIGVDRDPADLRDVYAWLAARLGTPDPCAPRGENPSVVRDDAPERRGTNKRCDGSRLVDSGYAFQFSTFREGYGSLIGN